MSSIAPATRLRNRLAMAGALTGTAGAAVAGVGAQAVGADPVPAVVRAALLLGAWLAWSARGIGSHGGATLGPAVGITLGRGVLVALLAGALGVSPDLLPATLLAGVGLVALGLDGLDGWVARRTGRASAFGATLDMELDALTVLLLAGLAWWLGRAGPWVLVAGLLRYAYGVAAAVHPAFRLPLGPRPFRRVVAGLAVGGLALALALPGPAGLGLCAAVVALLLHSFGTDALWQWRRR